jgi:predicted proteasome-type protease
MIDWTSTPISLGAKLAIDQSVHAVHAIKSQKQRINQLWNKKAMFDVMKKVHAPTAG